MRNCNRALLPMAALFILAAVGNEASGQNHLRSIYRDAIFNRPTVSPYLSLFNNTGSGTTPYHSYVRPQLEQQRADRAASERMANLQSQLNEQTVRGQQTQQGLRPTGHTAARMYYSHYFPALNVNGRR